MPTRREAADERPVPGVLAESERVLNEATVGVDTEQVVRDHMISHALTLSRSHALTLSRSHALTLSRSHALAAIASLGADDVLFFGGTALSRTHLTDLRLSEDIDLIALGDRREIADRIESTVARRLRGRSEP